MSIHKKITDLTELLSADNNDVLPIVDVSAGATKKIKKENIVVDETDPIFNAWLTATPPIYSETDPVFTAWDKSTGISITESQISDFGTYLESETDPVFTAWDKSTGISITESQISDFGTYLESESDPVYSAWDKSTGIQIAETQITDGTLLARLAANETITGDWTFNNTPTFSDVSRAKAYRNVSVQVVATATVTKIQLNAESYDTQNEFDSTTNYRFTATKAGYYLVSGQITYGSAADQCNLSAIVQRDGVAVINANIKASGTGFHKTPLLDIVYLTATQYLELYAYQDSGSDKNVNAGDDATFMTIYKLS